MPVATRAVRGFKRHLIGDETDGLAVNHDAALADIRFVAPGVVMRDAAGAPRLAGGRCRQCGTQSFPRAAVCTNCLSEEIEQVALAEQGTLYSYTIVHQAPKGWAVPYALGYIDLPGNIRVLAHLEAAEITIDMLMRLDVGVVGAAADGAPLCSYIFKPV